MSVTSNQLANERNLETSSVLSRDDLVLVKVLLQYLKRTDKKALSLVKKVSTPRILFVSWFSFQNCLSLLVII